jgi:hypothetical protein
MISVIHATSDLAADADDDFYRIPAGGRRMEMDWELVGRAFADASARLGWDADFELIPERQRVIVRFPEDRPALVGGTMMEFQRLVSEEIGLDRFMSIWIDFLSRR